MDEARFVVKCFLFAALLVMLSQLKTKNGTIETQIQATLVSSETASLLNKVADGGVKAIKDFGSYLRTKASATIQAAPSSEAVQEKVEKVTVDTKKAIQKIEASVKSAAATQTPVETTDDQVEEIE